MQEANQATLIAANLTAPFHPAVPVDVTRLDYYGRELEIGTAANNLVKLQATGAAMRKTWDELRPTIVARGGATEAKKFDQLMAQVQAAQSPVDFGRVAAPVLDEVDKLEKLFTK